MRNKKEQRNNRPKSYQSYEMRNMSPAARRRMEEGKRRAENFATGEIHIEKPYYPDYEEEYQEERQYRVASQNQGTVSKKSKNKGQKKPGKNTQNRKSVKSENSMLVRVQFVLTCLFVGVLLVVNVLPLLYSVIIALLLYGIWVLVRKSQQPRKRRKLPGKVGSVFVSVLLIFGVFYLGRGFWILNDMSGTNTSDLNLQKDTYSVYISGIDVYGEITEESRSDVNLIATVNPKTHEILLTTTPRDYYVEIPGVSGGEKDKLTHAGIYGVETSMKTLSALYDEPVDFFIRVNFTSLIEIVDALGGVTVQSTETFTTGPESGAIVDIVEGANHLNGEQALAFARERHALEDGDNQRGKNQQILLKGIFKKLLSPSILFNANGVLSSIDGNVETNMTTRQLQQFSKGILSGGLGTNIYSVAAQGEAKRAYCYSYSGGTLYVTVPDQSSVNEIRDLMEDVVAGRKLPSNE